MFRFFKKLFFGSKTEEEAEALFRSIALASAISESLTQYRDEREKSTLRYPVYTRIHVANANVGDLWEELRLEAYLAFTEDEQSEIGLLGDLHTQKNLHQFYLENKSDCFSKSGNSIESSFNAIGKICRYVYGAKSFYETEEPGLERVMRQANPDYYSDFITTLDEVIEKSKNDESYFAQPSETKGETVLELIHTYVTRETKKIAFDVKFGSDGLNFFKGLTMGEIRNLERQPGQGKQAEKLKTLLNDTLSASDPSELPFKNR